MRLKQASEQSGHGSKFGRKISLCTLCNVLTMRHFREFMLGMHSAIVMDRQNAAEGAAYIAVVLEYCGYRCLSRMRGVQVKPSLDKPSADPQAPLLCARGCATPEDWTMPHTSCAHG